MPSDASFLWAESAPRTRSGSHALRRRHPSHHLFPTLTDTEGTPWVAAACARERAPLRLPRLPTGRRCRITRAQGRCALPLNATHGDNHSEVAQPRTRAARRGGASRGPFQGGDWCSGSRLPFPETEPFAPNKRWHVTLLPATVPTPRTFFFSLTGTHR